MVATGGTITTCGNDKIHTFTGPGTFCVSKIACVAANNEVSYLVVAGGGAGATKNTPGSSYSGGGGGAGGFRGRQISSNTLYSQSFRWCRTYNSNSNKFSNYSRSRWCCYCLSRIFTISKRW